MREAALRLPAAAIKRSGRIVQQRWGEVFGALLVSLVLSASSAGRC